MIRGQGFRTASPEEFNVGQKKRLRSGGGFLFVGTNMNDGVHRAAGGYEVIDNLSA